VQVGGRVLVGSKGADLVWMYDSSNMFAFAGKAISVRFDARSLWLLRPDKKEIHLTQDYSNDVFGDQACSDEVRRRWIKRFENAPRPPTAPPEAVLIPLDPRSYFWINCHFDSNNNWDSCAEWDRTGEKYKHDLELVNAADHAAVLDSSLVIDPLVTRTTYEIHLKNGAVLKDWAKSRVNDVPSSNSIPPNPPKHE
jgi:hypothetical protein